MTHLTLILIVTIGYIIPVIIAIFITIANKSYNSNLIDKDERFDAIINYTIAILPVINIAAIIFTCIDEYYSNK